MCGRALLGGSSPQMHLESEVSHEGGLQVQCLALGPEPEDTSWGTAGTGSRTRTGLTTPETASR